ncbi:hypothetical protein SAMN04487968_1281, partial [Nocardioides terrae]
PKPKPQPVPQQPSGGTPGAANTGVPAGVGLTVHNGDLQIRQAGAVVSGLDVRGTIQVWAPNVTIKNTIVRFRDGGRNIGIHSLSTGLQVIDTEIAPSRATAADNYNGVMGSGFTLTRVDIHGVVDSVHVSTNDPVVIQNSWFHDNTHWTSDPNWNGGPSHDDNIQMVTGNNIRVINNAFYGAFNAGIQISQDKGTVTNLVVSGNVIGGGGCSINIAGKSLGPVRGVSILNNRFMRNQRVVGCGITSGKSDQLAISGNTWIDNGSTVTLK